MKKKNHFITPHNFLKTALQQMMTELNTKKKQNKTNIFHKDDERNRGDK